MPITRIQNLPLGSAEAECEDKAGSWRLSRTKHASVGQQDGAVLVASHPVDIDLFHDEYV